MEILILTVFVSLMLVAGELVFFAWNIRHGAHDHNDRLSLLPLEDERRIPDVRLDRDGKKGN